jgi:hypothetical protein
MVMEETRWGAAFPGNFVPMCMFQGKNGRDFRAFTNRDYNGEEVNHYQRPG